MVALSEHSLVALPEHSSLGASGASRWMACPGSVRLSAGITDEGSDAASTGTAAHKLAEDCMSFNMDPWQFIGADVTTGEILDLATEDKPPSYCDKNMADAVFYYLNELEAWHPQASRRQDNCWIEKKFYCPTIHSKFFGTSDFIFYDEPKRTLHVWDYKHGVGIVVDTYDNPQLKYYASGALEELGLWLGVDKVVLHIVQPRAYHYKGPHRHCEIGIDVLDAWVNDDLIPAMDKAVESDEIIFGDHCRFCPARTGQCPAVLEALTEYEEIMTEAEERGVAELTPAQLGRILELSELTKPIVKAVSTTIFHKLSHGVEVPGCKLVPARKNREFKKGAEKAAMDTFGPKAMTVPAFKTPAQIDALPLGVAFTARWAYKPDGGLKVALSKDERRSVKRDSASLFKPVNKETSND